MANAKKCDICTNYYEVYNTNSKKKANAVAFLNTDTVTLVGGPIDCCPTCMRAVQTFVTYLKECDIPTATELGLRELLDTQQVANARASLLAIDCNDDMTKAKMREYVDEAISCLDAALITVEEKPEA